MNKDLSIILSRLDLNSAPPQEDLEALLQKADFDIDVDYIDFIKSHNGANGSLNENAYILLWKAKDVVELNPYYEGVEEADNLFFIGSDGSNLGYAFDKISNTIVAIDFLEIAYSEPEVIAKSFKDFLVKKSGDIIDGSL